MMEGGEDNEKLWTRRWKNTALCNNIFKEVIGILIESEQGPFLKFSVFVYLRTNR